MTPTVEERLRRLEDLEEIRAITARYAKAVDREHPRRIDTGALQEIVAPDARWTWAAGDYDFIGRDAVIEGLLSSSVTFAMHTFSNPLITIDADTADATWTLWVALDQPALRLQTENITYRRCGDTWVIASIDVDVIRR
ncbi:nuclear transport factor 2 family protein [Yimella sp. cx-51]|uniref:nuclear transport factor 2 family protein n=1 Tax=Yimella sp. cx-51 TaxID=2770551 RepID=UPI00165D4EB0|nr:nuclear transport factor 2 family protein [Yimella sp. cx-51]MBC9957826.1 nuclear transport factor 2 family protein [Yimella sp. cx-51]QTH37968.1 nuclear transport factor 2 family protein [Yimella sp. cx-51]